MDNINISTIPPLDSTPEWNKPELYESQFLDKARDRIATESVDDLELGLRKAARRLDSNTRYAKELIGYLNDAIEMVAYDKLKQK